VRAAILAVGSELLSVDRLDTNALRLTERLERHGVDLVAKAVVGDDEGAIADEIARFVGRVDLLLCGGGLGPTADDVTREACARALGRPLVESPEALAGIERRFAEFGRRPSANNLRQGRIVDGAEVLDNPRGTAPGQRLEAGGTTIFLLPGVPAELEGLADRFLEPWLAERAGGRGRERRVLKVAMRPESEVDQSLEPLYDEFGRSEVTVLSSPGEIRVHLWAGGSADERSERLGRMAARARELLGAAVYGEGDGASLEGEVGRRLDALGRSVATAESCTGGLVAERLTRIPGSSRWFPGGVVTYSNEEKTRLLGVDPALLERHGAVSAEVARAMAEGAKARFGTDYALAVTGIAGPDGGSAEKPVGTVHLAIATPDGVEERPRRYPGDRERIRWYSSQAALDLLRRRLPDAPEAG